MNKIIWASLLATTLTAACETRQTSISTWPQFDVNGEVARIMSSDILPSGAIITTLSNGCTLTVWDGYWYVSPEC